MDKWTPKEMSHNHMEFLDANGNIIHLMTQNSTGQIPIRQGGNDT